MDDLEQLRQKINKIDEKMIELFEERMKTVCSIAEYKERHSMQVLDEKREKEVIARNLAKLKNKSIKVETEYFLNQVMYVSRMLQGEIIQKKDKEV
ncbi:chorismate mutase [Clostridium sp. JN-1]|uniref:chorismate mutase n=1 Tax=Clostridium sp. JN-1 TaxID=2483110 RepID=UPI000F0B055C|nr:chorismate mutase [Clostridium sp. JN-1]